MLGEPVTVVTQPVRMLRPGTHVDEGLRGVATLWLGDDRELTPELREVLEAQGFTHRFVRVSAIPDPRCTYSRSNEFVIPIIRRS